MPEKECREVRFAVPLDLVGGTSYASTPLVQNVGVDHGRCDVLVAEELLNGSDVVTVLKKVRGKGMTKGMTGCSLGQGGCSCAGFYGPLDHCLMKVVPVEKARLRISVLSCCWEYPLPGPLSVGIPVLSRQSPREIDVSGSLLFPRSWGFSSTKRSAGWP